MAKPNRLRLRPERISAICDYYQYDPRDARVSLKSYSLALMAEATFTEVFGARQFGYEGPRFTCIFWKQGWRHFNVGFHVHLGKPFNVELHIPFGFIKIGFTSEGKREGIYERILCAEIIRRFESQYKSSTTEANDVKA